MIADGGGAHADACDTTADALDQDDVADTDGPFKEEKIRET